MATIPIIMLVATPINTIREAIPAYSGVKTINIEITENKENAPERIQNIP